MNESTSRRNPAPGDSLRAYRAALAFHRARAWTLLAFFAGGLVVCVFGVLANPSTWACFVVSLAAMLGLFHGIPRLLDRAPPSETMVGVDGDQWRVGRYSEADLRALVHEVVAGLPGADPAPDVYVVDDRAPWGAAWEGFPWFLLGRFDRRIVLTSGSLHYLEPDEVKALLLHEIAHLRPECRLVPASLPLLADLTLLSLACWCYPKTGNLLATLILFFLVPRPIVQGLLKVALARADRLLEHVCDLFAGAHIGETAIINALLKIGEDDELTEAVIARIATRLRSDPRAHLQHVVEAYLETRPHGRIYHEHLLGHATAAVHELSKHDGTDARSEEHGPNRELLGFLADRRRRRRARIRWRAFDRDGSGALDPAEIARLCRALRQHPDHALVVSTNEHDSETHPSFRTRVLVLHEHAVEAGNHRAADTEDMASEGVRPLSGKGGCCGATG